MNRRFVMLVALGITLTATTPVRSADDALFTATISGLRKFDNTIEEVRSKGLASYVGDKVSSAARERFPGLFAGAAEAIDDVATAGEHTYSIQSRGMDVVRAGFDAIGSNASDEQSASYVAKDQDFRDWLPGKAKEMALDIVPEEVKDIVEAVESFAEDAGYVADKMQDGVDMADRAVDLAKDSVGSRVEGLKQSVREYFSEDASYGLEPGGSDTQQVIALATNTGSSSDLVLTVYDDRLTTIVQQEEFDSLEAATVAARSGDRDNVPEPGAEGNPFADDLAALGGDRDTGRVAHAPAGGAFDADLAFLANDLGVDSAERSSKNTDWAREARDAVASADAWERNEEEKRRQQAELQRERELLARQQAEQQRAVQAAADARAAAAAQAENERYRESLAGTSSRSSGGGFGAFLGGVVSAVGREYMRQKYGVIAPSSPNSGGSIASGGGGDADCPGLTARQQVIVSDIERRKAGADGSACNSARLLEEMYLRADDLYSSCPQTGNIIAARREVQQLLRNERETIRNVCNN
ncbi:MAG: hypothetical protein EPO25_11810 [Gammaproteobacteria bacterium]|nr:MAG: hypothetical protein EPO25_11810 [Gammaproteobacteria bacterium]